MPKPSSRTNSRSTIKPIAERDKKIHAFSKSISSKVKVNSATGV